MKILNLTLLLFIFFFQTGNSQTEPRLKKYQRFSTDGIAEGFWTVYEKDITYDIYENISFELIKYATSPNEEKKIQGGYFEYDSNQFLKKYTSRRYNPDVDLWITKLWIDYEYDTNGCLIKKTFTQNIGGMVSQIKTYERNENCQILSELKEWLGNGFDLSPSTFNTFEYHSDEISFDEKFYRYSSIEDSLYLSSLYTNIFEEKEKLLETHQTVLHQNQDTFFHTILYYDYDNYDNVTLTTSYYKDEYTNGWILLRKTHYHNEYDQNGFLIKKGTEQFDHSVDPPLENIYYRNEYNYKNSCEGIQEEYTLRYGSSGNENRYVFIYEGLNDCIDLEEIDLSMTIFPNPTYGGIEINSLIFQSGNTDILISTIDGKVLLQYNEISRCKTSTLDLSNLNNGIYILQLRNGKHFLNGKVIIVK